MNKALCSVVLCAVCTGAMAKYFDMESALRATYVSCVGIDEALHDMKVKAGISTAVTGVGTGLGIGATATGIAKAQTDKTIEQKFKDLENLANTAVGSPENEVPKDVFLARVKELLNSNHGKESVTFNKKQQEKFDEIKTLNDKSKKLGNWRTGLLAGNTATNIAGAAISGTNKVDKSLEKQIEDCRAAVKDLKLAIAQAKINDEDVAEAEQIQSACSGFEYIDISKINNRATGGMSASIVGAGTGAVGTIVSAVANSNKTRQGDAQKEKNLNAVANVLSAGSTVASVTATVFNATQIKAIKDVAEVAKKCTEVLK